MNLITNEWIKIFKRKATYIMFILLVIIIIISGAFNKYSQNKMDKNEQANWQQQLKDENNSLKQNIKDIPDKNAKNNFKKQIAINEYRIKNDLPPRQHYNVLSFVNGNVSIIQFVALFTIIIAAGMVANEFSWGTIKLLMIRPLSRTKILLSKYMTVLLFSLTMLVFVFLFSWIVGALLFGFGESSPYLAYVDGNVLEKSQLLHIIFVYILSSISLLMFTTMAFMISAAFRNSSLAIGISIFLLLVGGQLTSILALKFDWAKYLLFANTDLLAYFDGAPIVEGMTLTFSVIMLVIYFILFHLISFFVFIKRDIAA